MYAFGHLCDTLQNYNRVNGHAIFDWIILLVCRDMHTYRYRGTAHIEFKCSSIEILIRLANLRYIICLFWVIGKIVSRRTAFRRNYIQLGISICYPPIGTWMFSILFSAIIVSCKPSNILRVPAINSIKCIRTRTTPQGSNV